jgi:hypothetical protein
MLHYATFRGAGVSRCVAEQIDMSRTTMNMIPVPPFSATPACAFMKLDCAYELTGTQADTTA